MKRTLQLLIGIILIYFIFNGFQYYTTHKKVETYKSALLRDLEQGYRRITLEESDKTEKMNKHIQNYFDSILQEPDFNKNRYNDAREYLLEETNLNTYFSLETLEDTNWKAAQQSGVLKLFSKDELVRLNKVYRFNEILRVLKEDVYKLPREPFPFSTKSEVKKISFKYAMLLSKLNSTLYNLEDASKNAIEILEPDNKLITELSKKINNRN